MDSHKANQQPFDVGVPFSPCRWTRATDVLAAAQCAGAILRRHPARFMHQPIVGLLQPSLAPLWPMWRLSLEAARKQQCLKNAGSPTTTTSYYSKLNSRAPWCAPHFGRSYAFSLYMYDLLVPNFTSYLRHVTRTSELTG